MYSKPGCHLCEGLQEKLESVAAVNFTLEVRDITQNQDWYERYQYEVPVLMLQNSDTGHEHLIPRPSPRLTVVQLEEHLRRAWQPS
ncbi:MAG: glutaredoxin family protein [Cyanobacteria bacterium P01_F01_bin.42]